MGAPNQENPKVLKHELKSSALFYIISVQRGNDNELDINFKKAHYHWNETLLLYLCSLIQSVHSIKHHLFLVSKPFNAC